MKTKVTYEEINIEIEELYSEAKKMNSSSNDFYIGKKIINTKINNFRKKSEEITKKLVWYRFWNNLLIKDKLKKISEFYVDFENVAKINNEIYLENVAASLEENMLYVGNNKIDKDQQRAILINEPNVLVIAGAGTGKTTTITAKIKYLLLGKKIDSKEILVLTYTKNAANEMRERIYKETEVKLDIFTFHKLGKDIITAAEGKVPALTNIELNKFINSTIADLIKSDRLYSEKFIDYIFFHQYLLKSKFDFETEEEYNRYLKINPLVTLNNETVKSSEEVLIANFLTKHGIRYVYEQKYSVDTSNQEYGLYKPDFFLPDYDIWIEHFAIDENNNVPNFFSGKHGKSAKQFYLDSIDWKRKLHKDNSTTLIETYSYENRQNVLLTNLEKKLIANKVTLVQKDSKLIFEEFTKRNKNMVNGLNELFGTVIRLIKMNNYNYLDFRNLQMSDTATRVKELILPIYERYEAVLKGLNVIDFCDMINIAIKYVEDGRYQNHYKYVIVDEYQDMSSITYNLLKVLRHSSNYNLFCVGDDWQSIYRFAGSNVNYITNFEYYFGASEICFIPNTYRFSSSIAEISSDFITENPNQLSKRINSKLDRNNFDLGMINGYTDKNCVNFMAQKLDDLPKKSQILFLGRYNFDIRILDNDSNYDYKYDQNEEAITVKYRNRPDLRIIFRSAHAAKGLEADYVFIINNKSGNYGFPSLIQDNEILNYLLDKRENFPNGEERRLFYVALTRTRKKVWLLVNDNQKSLFVEELEKKYEYYIKKERYDCPKCGGVLEKKNGPYGEFFGCSNYPDCRYTKKIGK